MDYVKQVFNASTYAALRNMLAAIGVLLGMVGVVALSPAQIDKIIAIAQQVGTTLGAIMAFVGLMTPLVMGGIAAFKATDKNNVQRTAAVAQDPTQPQSAAAQTALVTAVSKMPGVEPLQVNADATPALAKMAMDQSVDKVGIAPGAVAQVEKTAQQAN